MKKLCSKKESFKIEEEAYTQKCWIDGQFKSDKDCWYCEGCDFYHYPNDNILWTFAPINLDYPQNYSIDEIRNHQLKYSLKKAKNSS